MEDSADDLVVALQYADGVALIEHRIPGAAGINVRRERPLEVIGDTEVVDDQATGLGFEDAIHARNRLNEAVPFHWLVDIHRVERRHVEAGQPHITHDHEPERICWVLEALLDRTAPRLVTDVRL